ncbi:MAG: hypothetical protein WCV81_03340 [Microgenomates group bacterium]|jgi:hypothetical protein
MTIENHYESGDTISFCTRYSANSPKEFASLAQRIRSLYVKAWLIEQGRTSDVEKYQSTGDPTYEQECGLGLKKGLLIKDVIPPVQEIYLDIPPTHNPVLVLAVQLALEKNLH